MSENKTRIAMARSRRAALREDWHLADIAHAIRVAAEKTGKTYTRIAMYDFDGTLFRSWEKTPEWWEGTHLDDRPYSFFVKPESLDEPCVPDRPGSAYWIGNTVRHAKWDSSDRACFLVVITGRVKVHAPRVKELLSSQGIRPDAFYFNPGMSAARFKSVVLKNLLIGYNTIDQIDVWENENAATYDSVLRRSAQAVEREVEVNIHHVHVAPKELVCGPEDFGLPSQNTMR
jgi:hypothetical protein